jgi:hypothetical protein
MIKSERMQNESAVTFEIYFPSPYISVGTEENYEVPHDTSFSGLHSSLGLPEYEVDADYE